MLVASLWDQHFWGIMENRRGALLMTLSMFGFALEDMFVKLLSGDFSPGQVMSLLGSAGALIFAVLTKVSGAKLLHRDVLKPAVVARNICELLGSMGYLLALVLTPLSQASAILQATPLIVTIGAAVFLKEHVGPRRWVAIFVGLLGVLLVIRPGTSGFSVLSLLAVAGTIGLALRDLVTRVVDTSTPSLVVSTYGFASLIPTGFVMMFFNGDPLIIPTLKQVGVVMCAGAVGAWGYYCIVAAMRLGDVSFVTPFRYTRMIFALVIAMAIFGEEPDTLTLVGAAIIIASGIVALVLEGRANRAVKQLKVAAVPQ